MSLQPVPFSPLMCDHVSSLETALGSLKVHITHADRRHAGIVKTKSTVSIDNIYYIKRVTYSLWHFFFF